MSGPPDPHDALQDDMQKFRKYRGQSLTDSSIPALLEGALGALTALVGFVWLASMLWVPETIDGTTWMTAGMLGLLLFGAPAGLIYWLRRGGAHKVLYVIRELSRGI